MEDPAYVCAHMSPNTYPKPSVTGTGSRVVLLHGFAQNRNCWGPMLEELSAVRQCWRFDAPGHGSAEQFADLTCSQAGAKVLASSGEAAYLGYSMGGRMLLAAALDRPESVRALVLLSATAGISDHAERADRRAQDEQRALRISEIGVESFVEEWLAMPMFQSLPAGAGFREQRLENTAQGLAASLRNAGTGSMEPLWDRLGELTMPVLCVAGGSDTSYVERAHEMGESIGSNCSVQIVAGVGHAPHLEAPEATSSVVRRFLARNTLD